jgi:predicted secreted protein
MAELGNNILVIANDKVICGTKANAIQCDCETIEIASASDSQWQHVVAGRKKWSVTVDFLLVAASSGNMSVSIGNLLSVDSSYTLIIKTRNGGGVQGSAILKTMDLRGAVGSLATGSWKFEGNGPLEQYPTPTT